MKVYIDENKSPLEMSKVELDDNDVLIFKFDILHHSASVINLFVNFMIEKHPLKDRIIMIPDGFNLENIYEKQVYINCLKKEIERLENN